MFRNVEDEATHSHHHQLNRSSKMPAYKNDNFTGENMRANSKIEKEKREKIII